MRLNRFAFLTLSAGLFLGLSPRAEAQPALTVSDVTKAEGNAGITNMNFTVTKAAGLAADVTVTTTGVTATGGVDYTDLVAFPFHMNAGQTSKNLTVQVNGDLTDEDDETFDVTFTAVTAGLTINGASTDTRTGTIAKHPTTKNGFNAHRHRANRERVLSMASSPSRFFNKIL